MTLKDYESNVALTGHHSEDEQWAEPQLPIKEAAWKISLNSARALLWTMMSSTCRYITKKLMLADVS